MPELQSLDVLIGRAALQQGKISRAQLDQAIARVRGGEPGGLGAALVRYGFVSAQDMNALVSVARSQEAQGARVGASGAFAAPVMPGRGAPPSGFAPPPG